MGQFPATTVSFNLSPDASLGRRGQGDPEGVEKEMPQPPAMQGSFQGTAQAFVGSLTNESLLILSALVTVYIVLGVLYESYIHPITILSTLPSAGVGAILALIICGDELTVVAIIGIVLLIGIVQKNAIMMIDFALAAERQEHKTPYDAIHQACLLRFRPILMTTMAAMLGAVPLALGQGVGSELRRPLGIAIIGGLIFSQLLTLYTTPVIYLFFDDIAAKLARRRRTREGQVAARRGAGPGDRAMSLSSPFIRRPIATTLLTAAVALSGVVAFPFLPVSPLPAGRLPDDLGRRPRCRAQARRSWPRPSRPRSSAHSGVSSGVTEMTAQSTLGQTSVTLQFDAQPQHRRGGARRRGGDQCRAQLPALRPADQPDLPEGRTRRTRRSRSSRSRRTSCRPPRSTTRPRRSSRRSFRRYPGVGQVIVGGSSSPAVRIDVNPTQLNSLRPAARGRPHRRGGPDGQRGQGRLLQCDAGTGRSAVNDQLMKAADYRPLIVSYRDGAPVMISDVAKVTDSVQTVRSLGLVNGKPAAPRSSSSASPGANIISTVDAIKAALPQLHAAINPAIDLTIALDQTVTIRASVANVERTLLISIILVVLVVFVFLQGMAGHR